jgi:enoyl-[acyl-carrier protein] reductase I
MSTSPSHALSGKRGLIMGVANDRSIAWGIARAMHAAGAELAFSYQGEAFGKRLAPLAETVGADLMVDIDVTEDASLDAGFAALAERWATIDFVVHAIAYSDKSELNGRFLNTTRANFRNSMDISAFSFVEVARRAHPMMQEHGGTLLTLTFQGSNRVVPNYNVMGVAKAALEAATRYLANDLGPDGIRVNAISPGPMKTLAGAAIAGARKTYRFTEQNAPLRSNATLEAVGGTAVYLASDAGACTTGEIIKVDCGYHILGMPQPDHM